MPGALWLNRWLAVAAVALVAGCNADSGEQSYDAAVPVDAGRDEAQLARFDEAFTRYADDPGNSRYRKHFRDAYGRISEVYVEPVDRTALIDTAIEALGTSDLPPGGAPAAVVVATALDAMTEALDPHSSYLDPEELHETEETTTGEFGGLGIQVSREDGSVKVVSPIEGTPADRAGIKPGDLITHVDGVAVQDMSLSEAVRSMRGEPGTDISLTVVRANRAPFEVNLTRAIISIEPVRWERYGQVGYLRIIGFTERTVDGVEQAVGEMRASSAQPLSGIVLDLRNNPGGLFDQSIHVADAFLDDGIIVAVRGRKEHESRGFRARPGDLARGLPIAVLINGGSASASEIVASALQDHGRAVVIGSPSFGKGSVQTVIRLPVEGALKLTTALYFAPSGRTIQARGVIPDVRLNGADTPVDDTREVDLPGAIAAVGDPWQNARASLDVALCPPLAGSDDRELACAVGLLHAGSVDRFLGSLGTRVRASR